LKTYETEVPCSFFSWDVLFSLVVLRVQAGKSSSFSCCVPPLVPIQLFFDVRLGDLHNKSEGEVVLAYPPFKMDQYEEFFLFCFRMAASGRVSRSFLKFLIFACTFVEPVASEGASFARSKDETFGSSMECGLSSVSLFFFFFACSPSYPFLSMVMRRIAVLLC